MSVDDKKLFDLLVLAKEGNTRATFEMCKGKKLSLQVNG